MEIRQSYDLLRNIRLAASQQSPFREMKVADIAKAGDYVLLTGMMNPIESGICRCERSEVKECERLLSEGRQPNERRLV